MREKRSALQVLLSYVRPFRTALIAGGALSLATAATGLALPLVVRELIDTDRGLIRKQPYQQPLEC